VQALPRLSKTGSKTKTPDRNDLLTAIGDQSAGLAPDRHFTVALSGSTHARNVGVCRGKPASPPNPVDGGKLGLTGPMSSVPSAADTREQQATALWQMTKQEHRYR
jgi:hypothetical protein